MTARHLALILAAPCALVGMAAGEASARPTAAATPACSGSGVYSSPADVDGDAKSDVVVGVPRATVAGHARAGAVDIHFAPRIKTTSQRFGEPRFGLTPAAKDAFGAAVSFLQANDDQCADLAIGAPGAKGGRGRVVIGLGSDRGVTGTGSITLTGRTAGERFGSTIVADGSDLWIGAPNRAVHGAKGAGAVDHYRVVHGTAKLIQTLTEDTPGIHGVAEPGDGFGQALDVSLRGPLIIGEPGEDVGHAVDAGTVTVVFTNKVSGRLRNSSTFSQSSPASPAPPRPATGSAPASRRRTTRRRP